MTRRVCLGVVVYELVGTCRGGDSDRTGHQ